MLQKRLKLIVFFCSKRKLQSKDENCFMFFIKHQIRTNGSANAHTTRPGKFCFFDAVEMQKSQAKNWWLFDTFQPCHSMP